jgi:hypothetical protein
MITDHGVIPWVPVLGRKRPGSQVGELCICMHCILKAHFHPVVSIESRMQLKELQMLLGDKLQSGKSKRVIVDAVVPPMKPKERSIELDNERGQTE